MWLWSWHQKGISECWARWHNSTSQSSLKIQDAVFWATSVYFLSFGTAYEQEAVNPGKLPGNLTQSLGGGIKNVTGHLTLRGEQGRDTYPPLLLWEGKCEGGGGGSERGRGRGGRDAPWKPDLEMNSSSTAHRSQRGFCGLRGFAFGFYCQIIFQSRWQVCWKLATLKAEDSRLQQEMPQVIWLSGPACS